MKKIIKYIFRTVVPASFIFLAAGCSDSTPEIVESDSGKQLVSVSLQTDWYAQPEHGGFYQAVAKGFYEEEGLQVEIRPGANINTVPQLVATGRVHFAVGALERMFIQNARNIPLVSLFPYFQHDPQCILFHPESGIETLADLDGREVMLQPGLIYTEFLEKNLGLKLQLLPLDWGLSRFASDDQFVQQCFLTNEPIVLRNQGVDAKVIPMSESGFDPYRHVYTNQKMIDENPEVVAAFTRASLRGWKDFMESDPMPAFELIIASNPQQNVEVMTQIRDEMKIYNLTEGNAQVGEELGQYNKARVRKVIEQLAGLELLEEELDMEKAIAFDLLPSHLVVDTELDD